MIRGTGPTERVVDGAGVSIATRSYGGAGASVLLIHGAGRNLEDWSLMVPFLVGSYRVVGMDLRCHGRSGEAPWTWSDVLTDVRAVVAAYGLGPTAIVGHSLGGMIATLYAEADPDCLAAVNLDGHGLGRDDQYIGLDPDYVRRRRSELESQATSAFPGGGEPFSEEQTEAVREAMTAHAAALGRPPQIARATLERSLHRLDDGRFQLWPSRTTANSMTKAIRSLDLFSVYRRVQRPLLIYNAVGAERGDQALGLPWLGEFMRAYRNGLRRDLAALTAECPHVRVETIDATHDMITTHPQPIASQVAAFISAAM